MTLSLQPLHWAFNWAFGDSFHLCHSSQQCIVILSSAHNRLWTLGDLLSYLSGCASLALAAGFAAGNNSSVAAAVKDAACLAVTCGCDHLSVLSMTPAAAQPGPSNRNDHGAAQLGTLGGLGAGESGQPLPGVLDGRTGGAAATAAEEENLLASRGEECLTVCCRRAAMCASCRFPCHGCRLIHFWVEGCALTVTSM